MKVSCQDKLILGFALIRASSIKAAWVNHYILLYFDIYISS